MSPLLIDLWILAGLSALTWLASLATREYSWVDRIWSIVPLAYVWVYAAKAGASNPRLLMMAVLVTVWGARLTLNFARKGGYAPGGEDYRWAHLRGQMPPALFQVFNLVFIVAYQNGLLFLITMPAYLAWLHPSPIGLLDVVLATCFLACLVGETVADQQQWNFQQSKKRQIADGLSPRQRFVQTGLFRYARHPNFFFEQAQWWLFFLMGALAAGSVVQWVVVGPLLLTALFIGSTRFTEQISLQRYPEYAQYQAAVSALVPWFRRGDAGLVLAS